MKSNLLLGGSSINDLTQIWRLYTKFRQLGLPNPIVDGSDSKPFKLERRFQSDLKSDDEIVSYRIVSVSF